MAISFIANASDQGTGLTSLTPAEPAGAASGDVIVGVFLRNNNTDDGDWTDPADWTQITLKNETTGTPDSQLYLGYKVRGADAGDGYAFSFGGTGSAMSGTLLCWRGVDNGTPLDLAYVEGTHYVVNTDSSTAAARAITTATNGAEVLILQCMNQSIGTGPVGTPSGYTERSSIQMTSSSRGLYTCSKNVAVAGTETPGVFTHTDSNGTADPRIFTIALRQAVAGGTARLAAYYHMLRAS